MRTTSSPPTFSPKNHFQLDHDLMQSILDMVRQLSQNNQFYIAAPYIRRLLACNLGTPEYQTRSLELAKVVGALPRERVIP